MKPPRRHELYCAGIDFETNDRAWRAWESVCLLDFILAATKPPEESNVTRLPLRDRRRSRRTEVA
jgi:hypothetical protein